MSRLSTTSEIWEAYFKAMDEKEGLTKEAAAPKLRKEEPREEHTEYRNSAWPKNDGDVQKRIETLYNVKQDLIHTYENNIMEVAHPEPVVIGLAYDRVNGLVENEIERQQISMSIALSPATSLETRGPKYASDELFMELVRIANDMDNRGFEGLAADADECLNELTVVARETVVPRETIIPRTTKVASIPLHLLAVQQWMLKHAARFVDAGGKVDPMRLASAWEKHHGSVGSEGVLAMAKHVARNFDLYSGVEAMGADESDGLVAEAAKKKKKKLDPKAKVRNCGVCCVPASRAKDHKDHFLLGTIGQARNALARVQQYDKVPPWYNGSLEGLKALVSRKVHSKYPSIKSKKKSKAEELVDGLFVKMAQEVGAQGGGWGTQPADQFGHIGLQQEPGISTLVPGSPQSAAKPAVQPQRQMAPNNPYVEKVQQFLKGKGFSLGTFGPNKDGIDGRFGPTTRKALSVWQASQPGLDRAGLLDEKTVKALNEAMVFGGSRR